MGSMITVSSHYKYVSSGKRRISKRMYACSYGENSNWIVDNTVRDYILNDIGDSRVRLVSVNIEEEPRIHTIRGDVSQLKKSLISILEKVGLRYE